MQNPIVSICCIAYNHENYIKECLDGFLMQKTNFPFEIIIHDDASTDNTANIIRQYALKDKRIKPILRKTNIKSTGVAVFPFTIEKAVGHYIAFCEGDDYWTDPYKLQKQINELNNNPDIDICSHSAIKFDEVLKQEIGITGNNGKKQRIISINEIIIRFGSVAPMPSILIRNKNTEVYRNLVSNGVYGGHGIMQVLWSHPNGLLYIPEAMSTYRVNSAGSVTKNILNNQEFYFRVLIKRIESFNLLDAYFNHEYQNLFSNKILEIKKNILRARQISIKDKINYIRKEKTNLNIINVIMLITRGMLSKIKHKIFK